MTPAEHLAEAERLLAEISDPRRALDLSADQAQAEKAIAHALIAAAAELGVPHTGTTGGGAAGAAQAQAG